MSAENLPESPIDVAWVVRTIDRKLPELARDVIRRHLDLSAPQNRDFLARPDAREQHQTDWHQWGIITHTRVFLRHFEEDVPAYLREWGLWEPTDERLHRPIDGLSRWELLQVAILLHDIGKFAARTMGRERFHFSRHERLSGEIIRSELDLSAYGLTPDQIEYIALTAEDHFVLGLMRKRAREEGIYDVGFTRTPAFHDIALTIEREHPLDSVEIGILFLGDSLAKTDPVRGPERAVGQHGVNIQVARRYLEIVLRGDSTC